MATAKQVCAILDGVLRLPENTARWHADRLRAARLLPSTQGVPEQLDRIHIASLLVAVVTSSATVSDYLGMRPSTGSVTLGEALARFIDRPDDLVELRIDAAAPGAVLTYRDADNDILTQVFEPDDIPARPAFWREVRLGPEIFINLAAALASAPEVRAGRPPLHERYKRYEYAVTY